MKKLPTWRRIPIGPGLGRTASGLHQAVVDSGCALDDHHVIYQLLTEAARTAVTQMQELDLVLATPARFGLHNEYSREEFFLRALDHYLLPCPSQGGVELRVRYDDQPQDERLCMAMEPIPCHYQGTKHLCIFCLRCDLNGRILATHRLPSRCARSSCNNLYAFRRA